MNYQIEIIKKVQASWKIWSFFKYQNLSNIRLKELIQEADQTIQALFHLYENHNQVEQSNKQFSNLYCISNEDNLLKPLILLNNRNIFNNQKYLINILKIIYYSSNNQDQNQVEYIMKNPTKHKEKKQLFKILELVFFLVSKQQKEANQDQILMYLDFILQSIMQCLQTNPEIMQNLKQLQKYYRCISFKKTHQGITQYVEAIHSFNSKLIENQKFTQIEIILNNVLQQLECVICYNIMTNPVSMKCGHSFCKECVNQDQNHSKKCPICRTEQVEEIYLSENNQFLTKLIQLRQSFENKLEDETLINPQLYINPQTRQSYEQKIVLKTKQSLKYLIQEDVEIDTARFKSLSLVQFQQLLQQNQIFILIDKNEKAYLVKNKQAYISKSKTRINIEYLDKIQIAHSYLSHLFLNTEQQEYIFESQFATAITFEDQQIDLENNEVKNHLVYLIEQIKEFFNQALLNQKQDQTYQTIHSFLNQVGFWRLQNSELIKNYDEMKKYSYLIPNILKIPEKERIEIQEINNLIIRLELIVKSLNRFKNCSNILMIFQIQKQNNDSRKNSIISILVFFFLILCQIIVTYFK